MENTFNPGRCWRLVKDDLLSFGGRYLLKLGVSMGIILVIVLWMTFFDDKNSRHSSTFVLDYESIWFTFGLLVLGFSFAATQFTMLGNKSTSIGMLMLPATQLEKFMAKWIIAVPGFLLAYFVGIEGVDLLRILITNVMSDHFVLAKPINIFDHKLVILLALFLMTQSFYLLGGIIWPKKGVVYTTLSLLIMGIILSITASLSIASFGISYYNPIYDWIDDHNSLLLIIFSAAASLFNYTLAYFRLKEMEIIQRW